MLDSRASDTATTDDYSLGHSERQLTGLSHWYTMLFPKTNQSAVAARWALRMWQAASSLEAIGQHWLGLAKPFRSDSLGLPHHGQTVSVVFTLLPTGADAQA
jgi:hypothetical protein